MIPNNERKILIKFIGSLQKKGNRQRAIRSLFKLLTTIKTKTSSTQKPLQILYTCLYNLKPAFLIRRHIKSGKRYDLPVPITENRAIFMAISWLRKSVLRNNKNNLPLHNLLANEINATLNQEGSAKDFLKAYIDLAIDQRPFLRFIKKRRFSASKSKRTKAAKRLYRIRLITRKAIRKRKFRSKKIIRKMNIHNMRSSTDIQKKLMKKINIPSKKKYLPKYTKIRYNKKIRKYKKHYAKLFTKKKKT